MSSRVWLTKCKHARNSGFRADRVGNVGAKAGSTIGRLMNGLLGRDSCRDVCLRSLDVNWTASVVKHNAAQPSIEVEHKQLLV